MKKFVLTFVFWIMILLLLCSCTKDIAKNENPSTDNTVPTSKTDSDISEQKTDEPDSIPDSLILEEAGISENDKYEITHNYDKSNMIDDVILTVSLNGVFGTHTKKYSYQYQYDTSTKSWNRIDEKSVSDETSFNEKAFKSFGHFTGTFSRYETGSYDIVIEALDFNAKTATVSYCLTFDRDSEQIRGNDTVEIIKGNSTDLWGFLIKYSRSVVVQFDQAFVLDIDKGLYAYDQN